ncbi:MAG: M20/M25/M40 family metallo-hydrolase [Elusimicrobia bacterium]|nr:M20/M25/M40 family metallo-hydrolase [Elusimicrobiota bacterium]
MADSEVVRILRDLIRFDTSNPPGNERPAVDYLAAILKDEGVPFEIVEPLPRRANIVARLKGDASKPPLLLSAHLDVVPALEGWDHPPFAAEVHDGCVWGRGAVDMKHMAAQSLVALLQIKRKGLRLKRDLIFAGVADEEAGGQAGAGYLVDHRPELIKAEFCMTEVGGIATPIGDTVIVPVQVAQKGYCWFTMRARGEAGHGSKPKKDTAIEKLAAAVHKLSTRPLDYRLTSTAAKFLKTVVAAHSGASKVALKGLFYGKTADMALKALPKERREVFNAMLHDTAAVTGLAAGVKVNVIPNVAEAQVDGRYLPDTNEKRFLAQVQKIVGPDIELTPFDGAPGLDQNHESELWDVIERVVKRHVPGCTVAPNMITGMTDAKDYARIGIKTYGFSPVLLKKGESFAELYHAPNERISISGLEAGSVWLNEVVEQFCAA